MCVDTGVAILEWSGACLSPEYPWPTVAYESGHVLVPATGDVATVELVRDGTVVATHATVPIAAPPGAPWTDLTVTGFLLPFPVDRYGYDVRTLDSTGRVLETVSLFGGDGDGDGEIPPSL